MDNIPETAPPPRNQTKRAASDRTNSQTSTAKTVLRVVCNWFPSLCLVPAVAILYAVVSRGQVAEVAGCVSSVWREVPPDWVILGLLGICTVLALALLSQARKNPVFLCDFYCFHPPEHLGADVHTFDSGMRRSKRWLESSCDFMKKVTTHSGLGPNTYFPEEIASMRTGSSTSLKTTFKGARAETEMVLFASIEKVLNNLQMDPESIGAVIINCTSFNPVPSLAACIINHFKMKPSVIGYNLSGMGCAASVIAVDLAREMLQNHQNMRVLIAGTENITSMLYCGNSRSMLLTNCLFRLGGVAFVLSNRRQDGQTAKYRLQHLVRTQLGTDAAYSAVKMNEDEDGQVGIKIGREVMHVAGQALTMNITRLAPLILPMHEKLVYAANYIARKAFKARIPDYIPDFCTAIDHFAIHPGGKAVIDTVEKALSLHPEHAQPNRDAFKRYGNTSSSSTWYAWSHIETFKGVHQGEQLWQLAFGSGFKCSSAIWRALRTIKVSHDAWTDTPSC